KSRRWVMKYELVVPSACRLVTRGKNSSALARIVTDPGGTQACAGQLPPAVVQAMDGPRAGSMLTSTFDNGVEFGPNIRSTSSTTLSAVMVGSSRNAKPLLSVGNPW